MRAEPLDKEDWEEVEKYYNLVEQNQPNNIEAIFFSAYGKFMATLIKMIGNGSRSEFTSYVFMLKRSISVISDNYLESKEDKKIVLNKIAKAIKRIYEAPVEILRAQQTDYAKTVTSNINILSKWLTNDINSINDTYIAELQEVYQMEHEEFIPPLIEEVKKNQIKNNGCYVATCVYGSYDCPEVWTLRRYRDSKLGSSHGGRAFIKLYYAISPTLVKWFGNTKWFKKMWRGVLDKKVKKLQAQGYESTPYNDIDWRK